MADSLAQTQPGGPSSARPVPKTHPRLATFIRVTAPFLLIVIVWHLTALASGLSAYFYPRPADVWSDFLNLIDKGILLSYIADSLWRWGLGVALGIGFSILLALIFSLSRTLNDAFLPMVNFFNAIADLAWMPLFVLWFGYDFQTILLSIVYTVFFPVLYNGMLGFSSVPQATIYAVRTLGANRIQVIREVLLPGALPNIVTGIRIGAGYAFRALIGAEMIAASSGLGYMIFESRETQLTQRTIVGMIIIGILWLGIDRLYLRPIEAGTVERWGMLRRLE
jgi:ABC-type nitrate/sulfonate/bicarbonate transport system permease component